MKRVLEPTEALCDDDAHEYDSLSRKHWFWVDRPFVAKAAKLGAGGRFALDIGCGPGRVAVALAKRCPHLTVYALDPSETMLDIVRRNAIEAGVGDRVVPVQGDACDIPFADHCFDLVLSLHAWHHLPDPLLALKEVRRILNPSGSCLIRDLRRPRTKGSSNRLVAWYGTMLGYSAGERRQYFHSLRAALTPDEMRQWACEAGLSGARVASLRAQHLDLVARPTVSVRSSARTVTFGSALRWAPSLAVAASLLLLAGIGGWRAWPRAANPGTHSSLLSFERGPVSAFEQSSENGLRETLIESKAGGFGRLDHADGTRLAISENSRLVWRERNQAKQLELQTGEAFLDVAPQNKPLTIAYASNRLMAEILGTRVLATRTADGQELFCLLGGKARILAGDFDVPAQRMISNQKDLFHSIIGGQTALTLQPGQTVQAYPSRTGSSRVILHQGIPEERFAHWLPQAGVDAILSGMPAMNPLSQLDLSVAVIAWGSWRADREGDDIRLHYADGELGGTVTFGHAEWESGTLSAKFALPAIRRDEPVHVGASFITPEGDIVSAYEVIEGGPAGIYRMRAEFEVLREKNTVLLHSLAIRLLGRKGARSERNDWMLRRNVRSESEPIRTAAPGVYIKGANAEIFDIRLEQAVQAAR